MQREVQNAQAAGRRRTLFQAIGRLGPYLEGLKLRWSLGLLSAVGAAVVALSIPQVLQHLVNSVVADGADRSAVWTASGIILVLGVLEAGLIYLRRFFVLPPASDAETAMRVRLFDKLQELSASFHSAWGAGQLQSRAIADLNLMRRWFAFGSLMFVTSTVAVLVGFTLMMTLSPLLAVIFLGAAVPVIVIGPRFRKRFVYYSRASQDQAGEVATAVEESVHGIRVLKAFGRGGHALKGFVSEADELRDLEVSKARTLAKFLAAMVLLPETVLGVCLLVGVWQVAHQDTTGVTEGALVAFFATAAVLKAPIEQIGMLLGMTFTAKTAIDRHVDVIDTEVDITSPSRQGREPAQVPEYGVLELDDVRFRFPDAKPEERDLIDGVSLHVERGETMALVSHTGGGTSTLLSLIPRLYDVTGGAVRIDGADVRDLELPDLRSRVAVAFEDPTLFSASVRSNVLLGTAHHRDPDDPQHPEREGGPAPEELEDVMRRALRTADAEFVEDLPRGVDTPIGEEGLSLSGGQRQRLALARAIAAAPSILLLDDPLSALDVRTEERVTERLREVLAGTTTLIVAHRPSTVALADRVALMHEGQIADVGTHPELLARNELYRSVMSAPAEPQALMDSIPAEHRAPEHPDESGDAPEGHGAPREEVDSHG